MGVATYVAFHYANDLTYKQAVDLALVHETGTAPIPMWYSILRSPLFSVGEVAPGLIVGWVARRHGGVLGATAGAVGSYIVALTIQTHWYEFSMLAFAHSSMVALPSMLGAAILGAVSGVAGEFLAGRNAP
jgi:hypothetical protein